MTKTIKALPFKFKLSLNLNRLNSKLVVTDLTDYKESLCRLMCRQARDIEESVLILKGPRMEYGVTLTLSPLPVPSSDISRIYCAVSKK